MNNFYDYLKKARASRDNVCIWATYPFMNNSDAAIGTKEQCNHDDYQMFASTREINDYIEKNGYKLATSYKETPDQLYKDLVSHFRQRRASELNAIAEHREQFERETAERAAADEQRERKERIETEKQELNDMIADMQIEKERIGVYKEMKERLREGESISDLLLEAKRLHGHKEDN